MREGNTETRRHALRGALPWTDGAGRPWPGWRRLPRAAPFAVLYIALSWALFLPLARPVGGMLVIDVASVGGAGLLYRIPDITQHPLRLALSLLTAPWFNHHTIQIVYVTVLMMLFGVPWEAREGTGRMLAAFFGAGAAGALGAGALLHMIYPALATGPFWSVPWQSFWGGGSAGCFGLMGAWVGRARSPWLLLGTVVLWEALVIYVYLREYTPVFHAIAFVAGFAFARYVMPPRFRDRDASSRG